MSKSNNKNMSLSYCPLCGCEFEMTYSHERIKHLQECESR